MDFYRAESMWADILNEWIANQEQGENAGWIRGTSRFFFDHSIPAREPEGFRLVRRG